MTEKLIIKQLAAILGKMGAIAKSGRNAQQNYSFRKVDDIMAKLQPLQAEHGVIIYPCVIEREEHERTTSSGGTMTCTTLLVDFHCVASDGSEIVSRTVGKAFDTSDKSCNKALTAAYKYLLTEIFCIPCEELDDADSTSLELAKKEPPKPQEALLPPWAKAGERWTKNGWLPTEIKAFIRQGREEEKGDEWAVFRITDERFSKQAPPMQEEQEPEQYE